MTQHNNDNNSSGAKTLALVGAGIAALAAGYYFLGPDGKRHQKHAKSWAIKMKADVIEKLEDAQDVTEEMYSDIVDSIAAKYDKGVIATKEEVDDLAKDLKKHWKQISIAAEEVLEDENKS